VANWERLALCEDFQTKGHDTKGKTYYGFLKDLFIAEISQLLQKDAIFGHFQLRKLFKDYSKTCIWQCAWLTAF